MNIIIYEDYFSKNFEPICLTRPVFDLRYGQGTLLDRVRQLCPDGQFGLWVRDELVGLTKDLYPDFMVNELSKEETIWLNARVIWTSPMIKEIFQAPSMSFFQGEECVGAHLSGPVSEDWLSSGGPLSVFPPDEDIRHINGGSILHYVWDLLTLIPDAIGDIPINDNPVSFPMVEIDETNGPVILGNDVKVEPFTFLKGPLYIGDGSFVASHSRIQNSIIGPMCKIGGEVSGTIFHGYSNKVHDGHLGDSYLGEWVNLGAGTTNSNLKNNYSTVSIIVNEELVDTNRLFLGSIIGDHSKTAIGTQLNTGTNIGVGCNVLAQSFPKRYIPSFSFCFQGKIRTIKFEDMIETAKRVKNRRNLDLSSAELNVLKQLFLSR